MQTQPVLTIELNETRIRLFRQATGIPVTLFSGNAIVKRYAGKTSDLNFPMMLQADLPADLPLLWYSVFDQGLLFGGIHQGDGSPDIFFGPVLPYECTRTAALKLLSFLGRSASDLNTLVSYFQECGVITEEAFVAAVHLYTHLLELNTDPDADVTQIRRHWTAPFPPRPLPETESHGRADYDLEQRLLAYIRHGRTQPFEEMLRDFSGFTGYPDIAPNPLHKHYIVTALTVGSRVAVSAGVDYDLSYGILAHYLDKLTASRTPSEYSSLFPQAYLDFAREVARVRRISSDDALVRRIQRYIFGHIHEKVTPSILAKELGYNTSYLCAHFKKETGKTVSTYVNECKVEEAKLLLEMPNSSVTDVAMHLGYPSQSYFCSVFKEYTNKTPGEYRAEYST